LDDTQTSIVDIIPNPAYTEYTQVQINIDRGQNINLSIFNKGGQLVRTIRKDEYYSQGSHKIPIHTETLPIGTYLVQLTAGEVRVNKQLVVLR
ncbi:MAG TPA: T9SS type A sorting domain-containing protein, partial [Saprospiraceae bacterium]|nr:T9SS type A sorting domain-containing protein [Saprospiraceae bacterium]